MSANRNIEMLHSLASSIESAEEKKNIYQDRSQNNFKQHKRMLIIKMSRACDFQSPI